MKTEKRKIRTAISYRSALEWILTNNKTDWIFEENFQIPTNIFLVCAIYDRDIEEVKLDLIEVKRTL